MASNAELLPKVGYECIIKVVRLVFECACYGIYLLLISTSTTILCRRICMTRAKAPCFLLFVTLVMFAASTVFLTMDLIDIIKRIQIILIDYPERSIQDKQHLADITLQRWVWTGEMLFIFMLILGDSVVIWRTWVLFRNSERYLIVPTLTWLGSVVAAFYELGCDVKNDWSLQNSDPSAGSVGLASCAKADTASFSLSYATNMICTFLIMYKAWMYKRSMSIFLGSARRRTQVEKILTLLVESGAIYLALYTFQAVPIYGGHFSAGSFVAVEAVNAIIQQVMGMYPTAIVVLVELQMSLYDTEEVTRERGLTLANHDMIFASREHETVQEGAPNDAHIPEQFRRSSVRRSTGNASQRISSTKVELEKVTVSKESIPGK